ncbi:MAG TPA: hypothetical protein VD902_15630 [Symbiobacteriaceae bacterium]|nr:hypothetical protein [Symbiobacteriaceae bacterium]
MSRTLLGRPVHLWLLVASAIAVVALFFPWYSTQSYSSVSWKTTGYEYSDGTRSTWQVPEVSSSRYGGGNGVGFFTLALSGAIAGLAFKFRSGAWPRWAGITLAVVAGLVTFVGLVNVASDPNFGPLLFAAAGALALPAAVQVIRTR